VAELKAQIEASSKKTVIDRVAYTWFNRFCALRFMDVNHYTPIGVVSPAENGTQPEILLEAKRGFIDNDLKSVVDAKGIFDLLNGKRPSTDPQQEAYRLLLVGVCNFYNKAMPFLFEKIADYTELLMPLDLLSENSVLHDLRQVLTPEACEDVEVIGWLYQYYISERKDEVFEALKENQKIEAVDIPAATQLFTPHWIVRYLVENSLGRLWMLNHPDSKLVAQMEYYIRPNQEEKDFLKVSDPEELRICDPACGSGHMLTFAFDLLYAIYEESGYQPADIPRLILEKNLFGLEIDPRAGALAAFAMMMKARAKDRRFFTRETNPNICVFENVTFTDAELKQYTKAVGRDLFTEPLMETLRQFEHTDNFGSLIRPLLTDAGYVRSMLEGKNLGGDLFLYSVHERVLKVLKFAEFLSPRYHVSVTNPPYMGGSGFNEDLKIFAKDFYPDSKSDIFAMFIERNFDFVLTEGYSSMVTMQSWMFLSSFEKMRLKILNYWSILSMAHLGARAFDSIGGEVVSTTAFVLQSVLAKGNGLYIRLVDEKTEAKKANAIRESIKNPNCGFVYHAKAADFSDIPGNLIAYWLGKGTSALFKEKKIGRLLLVGSGLSTSDNERFVRFIWEPSRNNINSVVRSREESISRSEVWYLFQKGGQYRKWFGNLEHVVNWRDDGKEIKAWVTSNPKDPNTTHWSRRIFNTELYFLKGITWSTISFGKISFRLSDESTMISNAAGGVFGFSSDSDLFGLLIGLNSKIWVNLIGIMNPTLNYSSGIISQTPLPNLKLGRNGKQLIDIARSDWDMYETSWGFRECPLLNPSFRQEIFNKTYELLRQDWVNHTQQMRELEEENNRGFIEAYGLQDELTAEVPLEEITLTCNPRYRYGGKRSKGELEALLRTDTMKEFISYAVGCMFGRYSLDKPGLVLANQGETIKDYLKQVPKPTFMPDEDNVIPVLEGEWFEDDIAERFKKFLRVTFGEEHYDENLMFIEESIGRDVRSYFVKEFYKDHMQTYKKRPIYWMFSSPKGSFNALIYLHRYQPDTVSIVLNDYLREYIKKLQSHKSHLEAVSVSGSASQSQKTKALKETTQFDKVLSELKDYEDEILYPLATEQVKIDLDDGVKVNYNKFGSALSHIPGLSE